MQHLLIHQTVVSFDDLAAKYRGLAAFFAAMPSMVDGAAMCSLVVADVSALLEGGPDDLVKLSDAARRTGYSVGHLRRMIKQKHLRAHRRGRRYYVALSELRAKRGPRLDVEPAPTGGEAATPSSPVAPIVPQDVATTRHGSTKDLSAEIATGPAEARLDVPTPSGYDPAADARQMAGTRGRGRKS